MFATVDETNCPQMWTHNSHHFWHHQIYYKAFIGAVKSAKTHNMMTQWTNTSFVHAISGALNSIIFSLSFRNGVEVKM